MISSKIAIFSAPIAATAGIFMALLWNMMMLSDKRIYKRWNGGEENEDETSKDIEASDFVLGFPVLGLRLLMTITDLL